ncbi:MAG: NAD+ synthase [Solibacterales bacterium]|nr:NAD+ synthase [Bryobacterales bacterium]|tara:strand:+ start:1750 stop:3399 length:1650 start_codon:yes stop_codon:yes gene_type:complete
MKLALGQINPIVGDFSGNVKLMLDTARRASEGGAALVVFPELALSGYPPQDLVEVPAYLNQNQDELHRLASAVESLGTDIICGYVGRAAGRGHQKAANCAAYLGDGKVLFTQQKMLLPTYDVFDEWRYFEPAERQKVFSRRGMRFGITICEDIWNDKQFWPRPLYGRDPVEELVAEGVDLIVNISSSPYHMGKRQLRLEMIQAIACRHKTPIMMVNQVGGNDQLVFDGSSFLVGATGQTCARGFTFAEDIVFYDTTTGDGEIHKQTADETEVTYDGLVVGTRDYVRKCGFSKVIVGLSGGIDSSVTAVVGADAVGVENVIGVAMPGPYSSEESVVDARAMAEKLGIRLETISINEIYSVVESKLEPVFKNFDHDVTEENLQARLRGSILMALSNKFGALVLTTGNKSELAVGYCTLYGDMCGGLAVISDAPKRLVYELGRVGNRRHSNVIPESVFSKPPSAELRPDQKDSDSLPDYDILDAILKSYVEECKNPDQIAECMGLPVDLVRDVTCKVDRNEYKRKQAAPGLRVTSKAFGMGRRFPVAQRFLR